MHATGARGIGSELHATGQSDCHVPCAVDQSLRLQCTLARLYAKASRSSVVGDASGLAIVHHIDRQCVQVGRQQLHEVGGVNDAGGAAQ